MAGTEPAMTKRESFSSGWRAPENAERIFGQALRSIAQRCVSKDEADALDHAVRDVRLGMLPSATISALNRSIVVR
jgi:hypothetical protein